jgi:hypothetical protein
MLIFKLSGILGSGIGQDSKSRRNPFSPPQDTPPEIVRSLDTTSFLSHLQSPTTILGTTARISSAYCRSRDILFERHSGKLEHMAEPGELSVPCNQDLFILLVKSAAYLASNNMLPARDMDILLRYIINNKRHSIIAKLLSANIPTTDAFCNQNIRKRYTDAGYERCPKFPQGRL